MIEIQVESKVVLLLRRYLNDIARDYYCIGYLNSLEENYVGVADDQKESEMTNTERVKELLAQIGSADDLREEQISAEVVEVVSRMEKALALIADVTVYVDAQKIARDALRGDHGV